MHRPFRFAPPTPAANAVVRPRLLEPLSHRFDVRLVTVEAGAGFGKTTLLAQAMAENRLAPQGTDVWLTCEPTDSSPSVFLGALLHAIADRETDGPPTVDDVCDAIWGLAPQQVCVVLDDAQHLEPQSAGASALQQLLVDLPENGHLLVAARRLPDLARSRLLLDGRVIELSDRQLALDDVEAHAMATSHGASPDVVRNAGGWPALAELQARLGMANARRFVWEEVVEPLDDVDCNAFLFLVAVGGADAEALAAATGAPVDGRRLASLPLVAVDDRAGLRPHALWEELLADRIDADFAASARRSLAEVLAGRGQNSEAFELLAASASWDRALEVLFEACNDLDQPPWRDQMARWIALLPSELARGPEVAHLRGTIERAGDAWSAPAREAFAEAIEGFRARGDSYREILASVRAFEIAWLRGERDEVEAINRRGSKLLAKGWPIGPLLALNDAALADIDGRTDDALAATRSLGDLEPRHRHFAPLLRCFAHLAAGDPDRAADDAQESALAVPAAGPGGVGFESSCLPAMVAWGSGDLEAALAVPLGDPGPRQSLAERVPTIALGAVVAAHVGEVVRARALVDELDSLVPDIGDRHLLAGYRAVAGATLAVADGDEAAAAAEHAACLGGRPLGPVTAGRAIRWLPSLPYLLYEPARVQLDDMPSGRARLRVLDACRALLEARQGAPWSPPALLDEPGALLTALPAPLAAELVVRAAADHGVNGTATIAWLATRAPAAVRRTLRTLAATDPKAIRTTAQSLLGSVPIPPSHSIRIEVLGPARLLIDGRPVDNPAWRRQRVRHLVCALVAYPEIRRNRLGTLLWPDFDETAVSSNLRTTLSYVHSVLEPERGRSDAPWFLQQDAGVLRLSGGDQLQVDAWELDAHLEAAATAAASGAPSIELDHLLEVLALWKGDYLDDVAGEEWAEPVRERMCSRFVAAAIRAGQLLVAASRRQEAIRAAHAALATDPWCEAAYRLLASAYAASGDDEGARRALESADRVLAELGIIPGPG